MLRHFYNDAMSDSALFRAKFLMELNAPDDLLSKLQNVFAPVLIMH